MNEKDFSKNLANNYELSYNLINKVNSEFRNLFENGDRIKIINFMVNVLNMLKEKGFDMNKVSYNRIFGLEDFGFRDEVVSDRNKLFLRRIKKYPGYQDLYDEKSKNFESNKDKLKDIESFFNDYPNITKFSNESPSNLSKIKGEKLDSLNSIITESKSFESLLSSLMKLNGTIRDDIGNNIPVQDVMNILDDIYLDYISNDTIDPISLEKLDNFSLLQDKIKNFLN